MTEPIRIVFAGTPDFALPALDAVAACGEALAAVYTQPDRRAGRGRRLQASPVKQRAQELGVAVEQPESLKTPQALESLAQYAPDLLVVVAYGLILPPSALSLPRFGAWNLHPSLLPRWRGAAPIQRTLLAGDKTTGVCLMQMTDGLDEGPVLARREIAIGSEETAATLHDRLATEGAKLLAESLDHLRTGALPEPERQGESGITYAAKMHPKEAQLDWAQPAEVLARKVRAFNPIPGARAQINGETVKVWRAEAVPGHAGAPGEMQSNTAGLIAGTGDGGLQIRELQRPGRGRISAADYLNAHPELKQDAQT